MKKFSLIFISLISAFSFAQPANDTCATSTNIAVSTAVANTYTADLLDATETIEGSCQIPSFIDPDAWYNFTMPVDGNLRVSGITNNDYINVYDSCGGVELACFFNNGVVYGLDAGQNYILKFARYNNGMGMYDFTLQAFEVPVNNECVNSESIVVSALMSTTYTATTIGATETIEASCESPGFVDPDVWFNFTMPLDGTLLINNNSNNNYITIYDSCGGAEIACFFGNESVYNLTGSINYILRFARYNNGSGSYNFTMQAFEPPMNDTCAASETIAVSTTVANTYTANTQGASETMEGSCESIGFTDPDVWYNFTMPVTGNLSITNITSNDYINVYDSCGGTEIACFFNDGIVENLVNGQDYILKYARYNNGNGLYNFTVQALPAASNDECVNRETLVVTTTEELTVTTDLNAATPTDAAAMLPNPCGANATHTYVDLWYEFVMPVNGNLVISNNDGSSEALTLYNACGDTTDVGCEFGNGIIYNLTMGATYIMRYSDRDIQLNGNSDFRIQAFETINNDECVNRETLVIPTTEQLTVTSEFRGATASNPATMLPNPCGTNTSFVYLDAWYEFIMPVSGNLSIINNDGSSEIISLYNACGDTVDLGCEAGNGSIYGLTGGATYVLRYSDRDIQVNGNSDFRIQAFATLDNDECTDRETIVVTTTEELTVTTDLRAANPTDPATMLPNPCGANSGQTYVDAWYEFIMPVNGNLVINNNNGSSEIISLYNACGDTVEVGCEAGNGTIYGLTAGATYVLRYSDRDIQVNSNSDFGLQAFETAPNDACDDREIIIVTTTEALLVTSDLRSATPTDASAMLANPCGTTAIHTYVDVWYEFMMPVNGNLVISNSNGSSEAITLYDTCGDTIELGCEFGTGLIYGLTGGDTYVMRYSDRDIQVNSNSDFSVQAFETTPNDQCVDAAVLNVSTTTPLPITVELRGASNDSEISCENNTTITYLDVWYDITMPVDGEIQVNDVNNNMSISFFDACDGTELTCFFNDGSLFNAAAGDNLKMRASVRDIFTGEYTFNIIVIPSPLPACSGTTEFISGAWNNGLPDNSINAVIRSNYNTAADDGTGGMLGSFSACSVSIDSGVTVTISTGDYLEVTGGILNNGTLIVAHQASIVQQDNTAITTNNGTINVNVTTPNLDPRDFMLMGSPMTNEMSESVYASAHKVLEHNTTNFVPNEDVTTEYPLAENFADDNGNDWTLQTGLLNPAQGYYVQPQPNLQTGGVFNLTFNDGTLNTGDITIPVLFNTDKNSSPNILSNPYPSSILADDFINLNPTIDELYFWEHLTEPSNQFPGYNSANFSMEDISMYNLMGGIKASSDPSMDDTKPNGIIATAQGFGIKANGAGTAMFANSMRRLTGNTTLRTPENIIERERLWLSITNEQYGLNGSMLVGFSSETSQAFDPSYDSRRLATILNLYSHLPDGTQELGIQSREAFDTSLTIPLGFTTQVEAENAVYKISLSDIEGIQLLESQVYLLDRVTNEITNLSEDKYLFTSSAGVHSNRFVIYFEQEEVLGNSAIEINNISLFPNPAKNEISITNLRNSEIISYVIYDQQGRVILTNDTVNNKTATINISELRVAIYFLKIETTSGSVTKRFIKE